MRIEYYYVILVTKGPLIGSFITENRGNGENFSICYDYLSAKKFITPHDIYLFADTFNWKYNDFSIEKYCRIVED